MIEPEALASRRVWRTQIAGEEAALRFLPRAAVPPSGGSWIRVEASAGREMTAVLWVPLDVVALIAARREPGLVLDESLGPLERALALEFLFSELVEIVEDMTGRPIRLDQADILDLAEPGFALSVTTGGRETLVFLQVPASLKSSLALFVARLPREAFPTDDLGIPISLRLGAAKLTLDQARDLRPGDGIVVHTDARGQPILVIDERYLATTEQEAPDTIVLTSSLREAQTPSDAYFLAEPERMDDTLSPELRKVGDLALTVVFEAGQKRVPLSEIANLDVGHRFTLSSSASDVVGILVAGQRIGTGRLIDIDGGVVVEVVTLAR